MPATRDQVKRIELSILFSFVGLYVWVVANYLWAYPQYGDSLDYIAPVVLHSHWHAEPPLFFLLMPLIGTGIFASFMDAHIAVPAYTLFVHAAILSAGALWLYEKKGLIAAIAFCIFFFGYDQFLREGTYIRYTQTESLFMMLAVVTFFQDGESETFKTFKKCVFLPEPFKSRFFYAGVFSACAVFSKPSAIAVIWLLLLQIEVNKNWDRVRVFRQFVFGGVIGSLTILVLYMLLVSPKTLWYTITFFFDPERPGWSAKSGHLWRIDKGQIPPYTAWIFAGPVTMRDPNGNWLFAGSVIMSAPVFAFQAYMDSKSRAFFLLAWFYVFALYLIWYISGVMCTYLHDEVAVYTFASMGLSAMLGDIFTSARTIRVKALAAVPFLQSSLGVLMLFLAGYVALKGLSIATGYFQGQMISRLDNNLFVEAAFEGTKLPGILLGFAIAGGLKILLYRLDRSKPAWFDIGVTPPLLPVYLSIVLLLLTCYSVSVGMGSTDIVDKMPRMTNEIVPLFSVLTALLILPQFLSSRILVVLALVAFALFATNNIRSSIQAFAPIKQSSDFSYGEYSFALKQVPFESYAIYVKKWSEERGFGQLEHWYAGVLYRLFFDKKHPYPKTEPNVSPLVEAPPARQKCLIVKESALPSVCSNHILTDDMDAVKRYFPVSKLVTAFVSPALNAYYVMEIKR